MGREPFSQTDAAAYYHRTTNDPPRVAGYTALSDQLKYYAFGKARLH
jgi:hypothetical protein